jgi:hypothetical protein
MKFDLKFPIVALALATGVVAGRERPAIVLPEERTPQTVAALDDDDIDLEKLRRSEATPAQNDLFAGMRSAAPKQVAAVPSEPPKPSAPPLPFQYIGKWSRGHEGEVLVMRGDELVAIERGQKLGDYRVDEISATQVTFTYLPLKTKQSLAVPPV